MVAVATGVSLDTTGVVSPRCSTTAVEAPGPQVDGSTSLLDEFAAPVCNIIEPQKWRPWLRQVWEFVRSHPHWQRIPFY